MIDFFEQKMSFFVLKFLEMFGVFVKREGRIIGFFLVMNFLDSV